MRAVENVDPPELTARARSDSSSSGTSVGQSVESGSSSSSSGQFSERTIIKTTGVKSLLAGGMGRLEGLASSSSSALEEDAPTTTTGAGSGSTNSSSYKRYRFGLTNHFLTMPELGERQTSAKRYLGHSSEGTAQAPTGGGAKAGPGVRKQQQPGQASHSQRRRRRKQLESDDEEQFDGFDADRNQPEDCDLSVLAGSTGGACVWDEYAKSAQGPLVSQPKLEPIVGHLLPAGDAGLDAARCNSKAAAADCYLGPAYLAPGHHRPRATGAGPHPPRSARGGAGGCASSSLLVRFSSIMYATFLVILGCILHVSELRQKSKNSSDHIYTTVVALLGIAWLLFLQGDLQRYKRYASKHILVESIFDEHRRTKQLQRPAGPDFRDLAARSTSSSSASLVGNDRTSLNTEVIFKKTAYRMYQQRAAVGRQQPAPPAPPTSPPGPSSFRSSQSGDSRSPEAAGQLMVPAYKFLHGKMGANFYLKCGMAAFCFGHVIHEGLRFGQQLYLFGSGNLHCRDSAALVAHLVTPLYSFYQLFMMFKYSNLVINRHKVLARFGLMHIIGTSITFWFRTILEEAFEDFVHKMDYFKAQNRPAHQLLDLSPADSSLGAPPIVAPADLSMASILDVLLGARSLTNSTGPPPAAPPGPTSSANMSAQAQSALLALMSSPISATITPQIVRHLPDSYTCAQNTLLTTKSINALPYLYPFTIEYNLLLAATFLSLYFNIGKIGPPGACSECLPTGGGRHCHEGTRSYASRRSSQRLGPGDSSGNSFAGSQLIIDPNDHHPRTRHDFELEPEQEELELGAGRGQWQLHRQRLQQLHERQSQKGLGEYKSNFVVNADCHSANKGLFCGFFVLLVTLVTIVIFFVTINKPSHLQLGIKINLIQEAALTGLILVITLAGFRQVLKLNRNPYLRDKVSTDDVLMLIPLPFFFIHSLLAFRAETASLYTTSAATYLAAPSSIQKGGPSAALHLVAGSNLTGQQLASSSSNISSNSRAGSQLNQLLLGLAPQPNRGRSTGSAANSTGPQPAPPPQQQQQQPQQVDYFKLLTIALNVAVMIEVLVQTNFIIDGLRRCSESRYLRFKKPGRELVTFAILLNITYWIVATFETKSVEQYKTEIEYYGPLPYMFISHTTLPVMLFYRYHSSVCLAEIWNRAYKPPKER